MALAMSDSGLIALIEPRGIETAKGYLTFRTHVGALIEPRGIETLFFAF